APPAGTGAAGGADQKLGAVAAAVLLAVAALVVEQAGAAQRLGHRAVGRGRLGVAAVTAALGAPAPAVMGAARAAAPAVRAVTPGIALRPAALGAAAVARRATAAVAGGCSRGRTAPAV